jgi:hypothetical protein
VNARGTVKLVGTAQRAVRDAWLFSSLVVVDDHERIGPALQAVYGHLGLPFDAASVGSIAAERPGLTVDDVVPAVLDAYAVDGASAVEVEPATIAWARILTAEHVAVDAAPSSSQQPDTA